MARQSIRLSRNGRKAEKLTGDQVTFHTVAGESNFLQTLNERLLNAASGEDEVPCSITAKFLNQVVSGLRAGATMDKTIVEANSARGSFREDLWIDWAVSDFVSWCVRS